MNKFLVAGDPPVSWVLLPESTIEMFSNRWDDCDESRQSGLLKFISLKTLKGAFYSQYLHFSRNGRKGECPQSLKGRHRLWEAREKKKRRKAEAQARKKRRGYGEGAPGRDVARIRGTGRAGESNVLGRMHAQVKYYFYIHNY